MRVEKAEKRSNTTNNLAIYCSASQFHLMVVLDIKVFQITNGCIDSFTLSSLEGLCTRVVYGERPSVFVQRPLEFG